MHRYTITIWHGTCGETHAYQPDEMLEAMDVARELSRDFPQSRVSIFDRRHHEGFDHEYVQGRAERRLGGLYA